MNPMRKIMKLVEGYTPHDPLGVVAKIRALDTAFLEEWEARVGGERRPNVMPPSTNSPFHLSPCGRCKSPMWHQPCSVCNYYPMGDMDDGRRRGTPEYAEYQARVSQGAHEKFLKLVSHFGNIAVWFFNDKLKTVAGKNDAFKEMVGRYVAEAQKLDLPDGEQLWDAYGEQA